MKAVLFAAAAAAAAAAVALCLPLAASAASAAGDSSVEVSADGGVSHHHRSSPDPFTEPVVPSDLMAPAVGGLPTGSWPTAAPLVEGGCVSQRPDPAVLLAARDGDMGALQSMDSDALAMRNEAGITALMRAAHYGRTEAVSFLLSTGLFQIEDASARGWTALMFAVEGDQPDVVHELLDKGARPDVADFAGRPLLLYAAAKGNLRVLAMLERAGLDLLTKDRMGHTAVMAAALSDRADAVQWLLARGVPIAERSEGDMDAVILAAQAGKPAALRVLLEHGASPNSADTVGLTALMWAASGNHEEAAEVLARFGANAKSKNVVGFTASDIAGANGHGRLANFLRVLEVKQQSS